MRFLGGVGVAAWLVACAVPGRLRQAPIEGPRDDGGAAEDALDGDGGVHDAPPDAGGDAAEDALDGDGGVHDAPPDAGAGPAASWLTYLGGGGFEQARDVAVDAEGNLVVVGGTASADFPATAGAYDTTFDAAGGALGTAGPMDVFVAKLSPHGALLWATLVGGPNYDRAYAVEVDPAGDIVVAGRAGPGFPTTPTDVVQPHFAGDASPNAAYGPQDGFLFKLSADGARLVWSTYFGGPDHSIVRDVAVGTDGSVYPAVAGAWQPSPHVTAGAFQAALQGGEDCMVAKVAPDGRSIDWGTYVGGSAAETLPSVRVDAAGEVVVAAGTRSVDLPGTAGSQQPHLAGGSDFFVARLAPDGRSLRFATYFGGSGDEGAETHHLALDAAGEVVLAAYTASADLPTTPAALGRSRGGPSDAFVARISADGTALLAATYVGTTSSDGVQGVAIDPTGRVLVGGSTRGASTATTPAAFQPRSGGGEEAWVGVLASDLSRYEYFSYLGGSGADQNRSVWVTREGGLLTVGQSASADLPVTAGAAQVTYGGGTHDAYVAHLALP